MGHHGSSKSSVAIALVAVVVLSGLALAPVRSAAPTMPATLLRSDSGTLVATPPTSRAPVATTGAERLAALERELRANGDSLAAFHPPNLAAADPGRAGVVAPSYAQAPAPMGVSDLGLRNVSGTLVPYEYNSSSVWGSVALSRAESVYVDGDGPDTFGIQLNAVATGITVHGNPGNEFWTQNFVTYTASTGELSLGDNVWNFSNPRAVISANVFAAHGPNGSLAAPVFYYAIGPTFTVHYPFTVNLYLNASLIHKGPGVYFNYSISATNGTWGGSFDYVEFAATPARHAAVTVPLFQVDGFGYDPVGLPNDYELVLVGNDDGDTTTFFAITGTLALHYWDKTGYANVPAAFDCGSDTGESSTGLLPVYTVAAPDGPPTLTLHIGPSFLGGLWNVSAALNGSRQFQVTLRPQNAFLLVSPGAVLNNSSAQWVPTLRLGAATSDFSIPNTGEFTFSWLMNGHDPVTTPDTVADTLPNSTTALTVALARDATQGSYTPLLAFGNAQLAQVSIAGGAGTIDNPYVLLHRPAGGLYPVFGQLNFFGFPVFAGVLLVGTTDDVTVTAPQVNLTYGPGQAGLAAALGLPPTNALQLEFWNDSHVLVANSTGLTGALSADLGAFPEGQVFFWNGSSNVIANNTFRDQGSSIALYGGTNNTVWGNTFLAGAVSAYYYGGNNTTGLLEWESGDLVYNNYFDVAEPAVTPTYNAFSCQVSCLRASYTDTWNVSRQPAADAEVRLGMVLSGSIIGTSYQGGNYWSNYGSSEDPFGVLPYDDGGLITIDGDYVPLVPNALYSLTLVESGLVGGTRWNATLNGATSSSVTRTVVLYAPNGSYTLGIGTPAGYLGPAGGGVVLNGTNLTIGVTFTQTFSVAISTVGLPAGWPWNITFPNALGSGRSEQLSGVAPAVATGVLVNGSQPYVVKAYGFAASPGHSSLTIAGAPFAFSVTFSVVDVLRVTTSGISSTTPWTVLVDEGSTEVTGGAIGPGVVAFTILQIGAGGYSWTVTASGYTATPAAGMGTSPSSNNVTVAFHAKPAPAAAFDWLYVALGAAVVLAIAGFALYASERRRGPRGPAPLAPASVPVAAAGAATAAPGKPATPAGPAPWEEGPSDSERTGPSR